MNSLRFRLIMIVLLAAMPMMALIISSNMEQRQWATLHYQQELIERVRNGEAAYRQAIQQTRDLLSALSNIPAISLHDPASCNTIFAKFLMEDPLYGNILAAGPDGKMFASALPPPGQLNLSDRVYFQRVVTTKSFAVGQLVIGYTLGTATLHCAYPILDGADQLNTVVVAALDLSRLWGLMPSEDLPADETFTIIDNDGRIIFTHPNPGEWAGKTVSDTEIVKLIHERKEGVATAQDIDGVYRLHAFRPLGGTTQEGFVYASIPSQTIYASANRILIRNILWLVGAIVLMLALAWLLAYLFVVRRVTMLTDTARKVAGGDLSARTGLSYSKGPLDTLARSFDDLVSKLQQREIERKQHETALKQGEERYRRILNSANDAIFVYEMTNDGMPGKFIEVNDVVCRILGYSKEELLNLASPLEIYDPEKLGDLPAIGEKLRKHKGCLFEMVHVSKEGKRIPVEVNAELFELDGKRTVLSIARDITERKQAEEALRESEERFRRFAEEVTSEGIMVHDQGLILDVNEKFAAMYGYERSELIGTDHFKTLAPSHHELVRSKIQQQEQQPYEAVALRKDGSTFPIEIHGTHIPFQGKVVRAVAVRDLTVQKRAEEALISANQRLNDIIEFLPDATFVVDEDKKVIAWNRAIEEMTGVGKGDMIGKGDYAYTIPFYGIRRRQLLDLLDSSDEDLQSKYQNFKKVGNVLYSEAYVPCLYDGKGAYVFATGAPLFDASGKRVGAIESIRDITERNQAEEALRASQQQLADIINFLPDATLVIDKEGKVIAWNKAIEMMTGIKAPDMLGKGNHEYALPFYGERRRILIDLALCPDQETERQYTAISRAGDVVFGESFTPNLPSGIAHLSGTASVLRDVNGEVVAAIECIRDNTERRRAEEALRKSEEEYRRIVETANEGIWVADWNFITTYVNQKMADMLGYLSQEIIGRPLSHFVFPEDLADQEEQWSLCIQELHETCERRFRCKDGSECWTNASATAIKANDGRFMGSFAMFTDITQRKRAEEERKRLEERLQRAEKMEALGTLAGGVAHDLNNVLGIVVGYAEFLSLEVSESSAVKTYAEQILRGGEKAAAIVQDLLTLTRRGVPSRTVLNLNSIVLECQDSPELAKLRSYHPKAQLKIDLDTDLLNISGSTVHLGKSLMNLVLNAAEAMPNGGAITIKTRNHYLDRPVWGYDEVKEGDYVVLSIADTGEGIPASDLRRIFEPFYTKKVMGRSGTGLGLAVVWGTVKDHLGYINVESCEGRGTTFTLYFPVTRGELSPEQISVSAAEYMGNGESLLVVDDAKEQCELATTMLTRLNYRVASVSSGEAAVAYLTQHTVDLIVLDMIMDPGMDGLDTYAKIIETHPHQKAIIVSGFAETERVAKAQALGAGAYVKKPYVLERLGVAVKKEFDRLGR